MQDLRNVTPKGLIVEGVRYDHPELQRHRAEEEAAGTECPLVRAEVRQHVGAVVGTRCHVRTLTGRLLCLAEPAEVTDPARQARASRGRQALFTA